ncbi:MAG: putative porin [Nitrosospira sp.]|nr:putative porin [Nitrosospira sp.]
MNIRSTLIAAALVMVCASSAQAAAEEREKVEILYETTLNLIHLLVEQGVIKREVADEMIKKAEQKAKASRQQAQEKNTQPEAGEPKKAEAGEPKNAQADEPKQAEAGEPKNVQADEPKKAEAGEPKNAQVEPKKGEVRVTYVPEHIKKEIRDQLRQEVVGQAKQERWGDVNAVPEWTKRFTMQGDVRFREQADFFADSNAPAANFQAIGQAVPNSTDNVYHRERVRLRFGINTNITRGIDLGLRLTTGNVNGPVITGELLGPPPISIGSPTSTLQTFGTFNSKFAFVLDQVFLRLSRFEGFNAVVGRFPNPFFIGTVGNIYTGIVQPGSILPTAGVQHTDLLWDTDLNFEGFAFNIHPWRKEQRTLKPFINAGIFPLQTINQSETVKAKDKWFYGAQAGVEWIPENADTKVRIAVAYFDYRNIAGVRNPNFGDTLFNQSVTLFRQKGNSLFNIDNDGDPNTNLWALAADYNIANVTMVADYSRFAPIHVIGPWDYARNVGYNQEKIFARTGQNIEPQTDAYQFRLTVGYPVVTERHQWQVFGHYRYSERDSMLDAFTDSNYLLSGTNHKGYTIHGLYGVAHNTWLGLRYNSYSEISGLPLRIDSVNLDLNARF